MVFKGVGGEIRESPHHHQQAPHHHTSLWAPARHIHPLIKHCINTASRQGALQRLIIIDHGFLGRERRTVEPRHHDDF